MKLPDNTAKIPDANGAHHLLGGSPRVRFRKNSSSESAGSNVHSEAPRASASTRAPLTVILGAMPSTQIGVLAVICVYAILFIYRTSFLIDGTRYFCLFDDDMISMRYAANFAHGHGLVWNPGHEKVLGFTNLFWVLYMSIVHLLPISAAKMSAFIQVTNGLLLTINLIFVAAICNELFPGQSTIALVAMVLTALDGPLNNWALQGTEVGVLALGLTISSWLALRTIEAKGPALKLYVVLGILTLFRIDMAVGAGTILLALTAIEPQKWKEHLLIGGAILTGFLLAQLGFNLWYYGQALPNTYYLKMTGYPLIGRIRRGFLVSIVFLLPLTPLVLAALARLARRNMGRGDFLLTAAVGAQLAYSVWVGGDAWEWWGGSNRYVSIAMPLFFILASPALVRGALWISQRARPAEARLAEAFALTSIVFTAILFMNAYGVKKILLIEPPPQTSKPQPGDSNEDMVRRSVFIDRLTDPDATVAVVWAGSLPYFADRYAIDLLGKNDPKIALEKMHTELAAAQSMGFWPGHLKWDYDYSIGQLRPDVVVQVWAVEPQTIPWLQRDYLPARFGGYLRYLRRGSPHIRWSELGLQNGAAITTK
jgi:hypothetical protein